LHEIQAQAVVDLSKLNLDYVLIENNGARLGAMTPLQTLVEAPELQSVVQGIVPETARLAAHLGLRQLATLEGALLSRKNLPELTLALLALDAEVVVAQSHGGQLEVPLAEYLAFQWPVDELMLEVKFTAEPNHRIGGAVERVARAPRDGAVLAVAAVLRMENNICRRARVTLSHAGSEAELMVAFVPRLEGQAVTSGLLQGVAEAVQSASKPLGDFRASADYRFEMIGVLTRRALESAWRRAGA
jgi:carbon-monoxide dehydrogenase medium subunit